MFDKIILGFLMDSDSTGYTIIKKMKKNTNVFYNSSAGSIYPALQKLVNENLVTMEQKLEGGRAKKLYSITDRGKKDFINWLQEDMDIKKDKRETLIRVFFFSHLPQKKQTAVINSYINKLNSQLEALKIIQSQLTEDDNDYFRTEILQLGIDQFRFNIKWYENLLQKSNKDNHHENTGNQRKS